MNSSKKVLVLFSGGRDSSSVAIEMARAKYLVKLFTYQAGSEELIGHRGDSAPDIRHAELLKAFPHHIDADRVITGNTYLIRKLAIEKTNNTHVVYPIALTLAVHTNAILYCLKNDIHNIACGYSGYQARKDRYIEQREDFLELTRKFLKEYGITYHAPIIKKSKEEVMDILDKHGISSNSLENKSVFGAVAFDVDRALSYWNESITICKKYINQMRPSE
ncbi:MAG TPA: hypothetical protein ENI63_02290 [Candidatus Kaiserbacteria bacterium]|nr:hypothetical protein [Candidatus Kaiserbacteria bacterium]